MNDASLDIVHAATDYGEYDELMDEYLSCIKMTDAAVQELCDYFTAQYEKTGRKVIVAMAGDHAPSFVTHVADPSFAAAGNDLELLGAARRSSSGPTTRWSTRTPPSARPTR